MANLTENNQSTNYVFESIKLFMKNDLPLIIKHLIAKVNYVYFKIRSINESNKSNESNDD